MATTEKTVPVDDGVKAWKLVSGAISEAGGCDDACDVWVDVKEKAFHPNLWGVVVTIQAAGGADLHFNTFFDDGWDAVLKDWLRGTHEAHPKPTPKITVLGPDYVPPAHPPGSQVDLVAAVIIDLQRALKCMEAEWVSGPSGSRATAIASIRRAMTRVIAGVDFDPALAVADVDSQG